MKTRLRSQIHEMLFFTGKLPISKWCRDFNTDFPWIPLGKRRRDGERGEGGDGEPLFNEELAHGSGNFARILLDRAREVVAVAG